MVSLQPATCHDMVSSSTSTENSDAGGNIQQIVDVEVKPRAKARPRTKPVRPVQHSLADKAASSQQSFLLTFHQKLEKAIELGKGCLSCGQDCLERVKSFRLKLCDWRREFQSLSSDVQDRELLWIFGRGRPDQKAVEPVLRSRQPSDSSSASTEQSPNELQQVISTSTSGSDQEVLNLTYDDTDVPNSLSQSGPACASGNKRKYTARKTKSKTLSVQLQGILCEESCFVCVGTAKFLLGIGSGRYVRVSLVCLVCLLMFCFFALDVTVVVC